MVEHQVTLRGLGLNGEGDRPTILARTDQRFLPGILDELEEGGDLTTLRQTVSKARDESGMLKLFQPVQRTFNLVLVEARCDIFGEPRLDPNSIESAGMVVRRMEVDNDGQPVAPERLAGWREANNSLRGWVDYTGTLFDGRPSPDSDLDLDPDPGRRPPALSAGNGEINRRLAESIAPSHEPLTEQVTTLFVAPPDVCEAAKRTVLYGVLPVTSPETSEEPRVPIVFTQRQASQTLSVLLKSSFAKTQRTSALKWLGKTLHAETWESEQGIKALRVCLQQLLVSFDAFGESAESRQLFDLVNEIRLDYGAAGEKGAADLLKVAANVLIHRKPSTDSTISPQPDQITMPDRWPAVSGSLRDRVVQQVRIIMEKRMASITPGEGRYDRLGRHYRLRSFIRVKRPNGCPPKLVWSEFSEPFTIAPWFESNEDARPTQINVPDPFAPGFLESVKPNVAFNIPESMFDLVESLGLDEVKDLLDGKKPELGGGSGGGLGLGWICGLNISIIFIVAFILLFMFLMILNIFFSWLLFVKICLPIPTKQD